jgi:hypothetical protein
VFEITLTPALSHEYVGEGEKPRTRFINRALSSWLSLKFRPTFSALFRTPGSGRAWRAGRSRTLGTGLQVASRDVG